MKVLVFIGNNISVNNYDFNDYYVIGVDKGALLLIRNNIKCDEAIGDFDSVCQVDLELIKKNTKVTVLNMEKDDTDTFVSIKRAYEISDDVTILGGIEGRRIEHFIANLNLLSKYDNLKLIDDNSYIFKLNTSTNLKKDEYKYISFFALEDSIISLEGFKYNLCNYNLKVFDSLCVSNEIQNLAKISLNGKILVIKSKNDNNSLFN